MAFWGGFARGVALWVGFGAPPAGWHRAAAPPRSHRVPVEAVTRIGATHKKGCCDISFSNAHINSPLLMQATHRTLYVPSSFTASAAVNVLQAWGGALCCVYTHVTPSHCWWQKPRLPRCPCGLPLSQAALPPLPHCLPCL